MANQVIRKGRLRRPRLAAGADCAFSRDGAEAVAAIVVWNVAERTVVEEVVARRRVAFPYVPGLLSFREAPVILDAVRKLRCEPDVFLFDGHGFAHPRRFGLACHVGLLLERPSLGCAKSILVGVPGTVGSCRGSTAPLTHQGERIGTVVRTRDGVRPVYVSVGHRLSLTECVRIVLACGDRFRLPEPTRLADRLVARLRHV